MSNAESSGSHAGSKRAAGDGNDKGSSKRRKDGSTYLDQVLKRREKEVHKVTPVKDMNQPSVLVATARYWIDTREVWMKSFDEATKEDKVTNAQQYLHALHRTSSLLARLDEIGNSPEWSSMPSQNSPASIRKQLDRKIESLKRHDFSLLDDATIFDMGIDSDYSQFFKERVWWAKANRPYLQEEHFDRKVFEMQDVSSRFEALRAFVLRTEPKFTDTKEELKHYAETWARVTCLYHSLKDVTPDAWPEQAQSWNADKVNNGVKGFLHSCRSKESRLSKKLGQCCDDDKEMCSPDGKRTLFESISQRDPEYLRVLKMKFEQTFLEGETIETEPFAERDVVDIEDPFDVKRALQWFVDRNDEIAFKDIKDKACKPSEARRAKFLRDWKRVFALQHRIEQEMSTKPDMDHKDDCGKALRAEDIVKQADAKMVNYVKVIKANTVDAGAGKRERRDEDLGVTSKRDSKVNAEFYGTYWRRFPSKRKSSGLNRTTED